MDRGNTVLPAGAVQSFVRSLRRLVLHDDNDDKSPGSEGARLGIADEWHGKERSGVASNASASSGNSLSQENAFASSGNTLSQENAPSNGYLATSNQAEGFSERDSRLKQEDIMIMQESNEEPMIAKSIGREAKEEPESQFYTTAANLAYFDIDRRDTNIHDIIYEDMNSPVFGNTLSVYDGIEESLERMNSPTYRTALSIYDMIEDSPERNVNGETDIPSGVNGDEASKRINISSDLTEPEKTKTTPELQTYGQKVIGIVQTIDGDLERENSDRQEIQALPLVGTDSAAEQIVRNPSTDTEPAPLPDLVKAKDVINQLSEETASKSNVSESRSDEMIVDAFPSANSMENEVELHKYLQPEALVFASESESLFHWEDSLYGRNKIHADLEHPLETFF